MKKMLFVLLTLISLSFGANAAVNINTATQSELESLNGIGPVKAQAIIDYRKKNGGFKTIDELEKVDGIGSITLQNVRKEVSVSGKSTVSTTATDKSKKETKPTAKDTKSVGTEKAATSGKTAVKKTEADKKTAEKKSTAIKANLEKKPTEKK